MVAGVDAGADAIGRHVRHSYWQRIGGMPLSAPTSDLPGAARFVIIGGGFAGLATALRMTELKPGAEIVLLEAKSVGYGASGRNGGLISPLAAPVWLAGALQEPALARAMRLLNIKAAEAAAWAQARAPGAEVRESPLLLQAQGPVTRAGLAQVSRILDGAQIAFGQAADASGGARASLVIAANTINPYALVSGLADAARRAGVLIVEGAAVQSIVPQAKGARVVLADGRAIAAGERVVVATNAYTASLAMQEPPRAKTVYNYMIATEALAPEHLARLAAMGAGEGRFVVELNTAYVFYRVHDGRLVFGGIEKSRAAAPGDLDVPEKILGGLQALLGNTLGDVPAPAVAEAWGGRFHMTATDLPIIRQPEASPAILYNVGYGGTGVALTLSLAPVAAAMALGRPIADKDLAEIDRAMRATRLPVAGGLRFAAGVAGAYFAQWRKG